MVRTIIGAEAWMIFGLLHELCWWMDEMLPPRHYPSQIMCAWHVPRFLFHTKVMHVIGVHYSLDFFIF